MPASGLKYQSSAMPKAIGQWAVVKPSGVAKMKAERRRGSSPIGATPAISAMWSAQAPAALMTMGAS